VIICFIIYLLPASPRTSLVPLRISPMPFWIFAVVSTVARIPGTWASPTSARTSRAAVHLRDRLSRVFVALCLPLYYYRERFIKRSTSRERIRTKPRKRLTVRAALVNSRHVMNTSTRRCGFFGLLLHRGPPGRPDLR